MKQVALAFLIILVLFQCGMKTAIVAHYRINKASITANFCENKSNPSMHCEGKCYLSKKMKAQEEQEKSVPSVLKGLEEMVLFCSSYELSFASPTFTLRDVVKNIYFVKQYDSPALTIFQPPQ